MGEIGIYDLEDVSYTLALDEIEERASEYSTVRTKQYTKKFIPPGIAPDIEGANSDEMSLGYLGGGEWVFLKPGSINLGTAAASHLGAYTVLNQTDLNAPDMDYSEGQIIIEHLGNLESPFTAVKNNPSNYDALVDAIAGKAILGDNDFGGNIGFNQGQCYVFDFDKAGSTITDTEAAAYDYIERIDRLSEVDAQLEDVESAMEKIADSFNIAELEDSLDILFDSLEQKTEKRGMRLSTRDFIRNIQNVKDGRFFNTGVVDRMDALNKEIEQDNTEDVFKRNIQKAMLD